MTGFMLYQKLNGKWRDERQISEYRIDTGGKGGISFRGTESG